MSFKREIAEEIMHGGPAPVSDLVGRDVDACEIGTDALYAEMDRALELVSVANVALIVDACRGEKEKEDEVER